MHGQVQICIHFGLRHRVTWG